MPTTPPRPAWRPMIAADLPGVSAVAALAFPDHYEAPACFAERLALCPSLCFALAAGDAVMGYVIAYPWPFGRIPPLNSALGGLPAQADAFYLHDLALHPAVRGQGHAAPGIALIVAAARAAGIERIALVSVNESTGFWQAHGFRPVPEDAALRAKLVSYGPDARYMVAPVSLAQSAGKRR